METVYLENIIKNLKMSEKIALIEFTLKEVKNDAGLIELKKKNQPKIKSRVEDFKFCGMWADNKDMNESTIFIRKLRNV